jgi:hypothetical protein
LKVGKQSLLELHKVPTAEEWFDALIEAWEHKRDELGADANAFFKLERSGRLKPFTRQK